MPINSHIFRQPKPFYLIFLLEFWERFGFYGVQAILAIYFVQHMGYSEKSADMIFGAYSSLTFGLIVFGGKLGDKWIGTKRTIVLGALILGIGYFMLGLSGSYPHLFFAGLATVAAGNGVFKANPSNLLSHCYKKIDPRLDGAFTMYYMAINLGSLFSLLLIPYIASAYQWSTGFYVCTAGLVICLVIYFLMRSCVRNSGSEPDRYPVPILRWVTLIGAIIVVILFVTWLLQHLQVAHIIMYCIGIGVMITFAVEMFKRPFRERLKMLVAIVLTFEAFLFFILYTQMFTSLNFFAMYNVKHNLLGIPIQPSSFVFLNAFWIVVLSPLLAWIFNRQGIKGRDMSMPVKFATGMFFCACAFFTLPVAINTANPEGIISSGWLILFYGLISTGELFISALGLSMITKLVPKNLRGFFMGAWFLTTAFASIVSGYVASMASAPSQDITAMERLPLFEHTFTLIGTVVFIAAVLMMAIAPWLARVSEQGKADQAG